MGGKEDEIAFTQRAIFGLALDTEPGTALDQQDPLGGLLIVPLPFRRRLPSRDDPLDAQARKLKKRFNELRAERLRRETA